MPQTLGSRPTDPNYRQKQVQGVSDSAFKLLDRMRAKKKAESDDALENLDAMMDAIIAGTLPADAASVQAVIATARQFDPQKAALASSAVDGYLGKQQSKKDMDDLYKTAMSSDDPFATVLGMPPGNRLALRQGEYGPDMEKMGFFSPDATKGTAQDTTLRLTEDLDPTDPRRRGVMIASGQERDVGQEDQASRFASSEAATKVEQQLATRRADLEGRKQTHQENKFAAEQSGAESGSRILPKDLWASLEMTLEFIPDPAAKDAFTQRIIQQFQVEVQNRIDKGMKSKEAEIAVAALLEEALKGKAASGREAFGNARNR